MIGRADMSTPVTRGELREEIQRLDLRLDHLDQKFEHRLAGMATQMATKADLAQLEAKMATKADLDLWGEHCFERLLTELARHTKAIQEALSTQISTFDDKYAELPARVSRVEAAVFAPKER